MKSISPVCGHVPVPSSQKLGQSVQSGPDPGIQTRASANPYVKVYLPAVVIMPVA
jgi:hypothetical protein